MGLSANRLDVLCTPGGEGLWSATVTPASSSTPAVTRASTALRCRQPSTPGTLLHLELRHVDAAAPGIAIHKHGRPGRPSGNLQRARYHLRPLSQDLRIRPRTLSALPSPSARRAFTSRAGQAGRPTAGGAATQCWLRAYR